MAQLLGDYLKKRFGCKVYKIALDGGFTCPNRDGTIGERGCIFCSANGGGDFAMPRTLNITEQIEAGKQKVSSKIKNGKYIAYFQAFTGTYAPPARLKALYTEAIVHPDIVALSVATRPDCLPDEVLDLLSRFNQIKPVFVELGLQTIHARSAGYIRRGYPLSVYDAAVEKLHARGLNVVVHVILGLPGESREEMLETVKYVCASGANGIKLQLLHVLLETDLHAEYEAGRIQVLTEDEYIDLLKECLKLIPKDMVIHRLTGDGDKRILVAPLWSADKKHVWNRIQKEVLGC
ncbi:MAG: TIGR01212 family radical SAM protein [Clostridiales bacterium]|nr:TIGR01212 family radical SAM protein [Clostridiales bacterium]